MHTILKEKLSDAHGSSDHVIVIFLDVRGFSSFAGVAESIDAALFLRSVYSRILDRYFPEVAFFKLTGDGMMIIRKYEQDTLAEIVNDSIRKSIALVEAFSDLCSGDDMINFPVPEFLGVGIARGAATRLANDEIILDYSGRPLNLAARLMDFARPSGVVFQGESLGLSLISADLLSQFTEDRVYVKGIAEDSPLSIQFLTARTKISPTAHLPINKFITRRTKVETLKLNTIRDRRNFFHMLPEEPDLVDECKIFFRYPKARANGTKHPTEWFFKDYPAKFKRNLGRPGVSFNYPTAYRRLVSKGVKNSWPIKMYIEYVMRDDGSGSSDAHPLI